MSDTIILNGLSWDKENLEVNGQTHFTYEEAKAEATKIGKRLPTKSEFDALLQLHHVFDLDKCGMWFAEKLDDLKTDKSLFLKAAGDIDDDGAGLYGVSIYGYYWSNTGSESNRWHGYYLYFGSKVNGVAKDSCSYGFSVICISDVNKQETMKTNQEIEFKIPEGYVIDNSKSTENKIVCKPIEPQYPKIWEDVFWAKPISGFDIKLYNSDIISATSREKALFKTKKQAAFSLAYAQLTQLMALPCYNGDWTPNWDSQNQEKYCITRLKSGLVELVLSFKSSKIRDAFFHNHMDLIKQFHQL